MARIAFFMLALNLTLISACKTSDTSSEVRSVETSKDVVKADAYNGCFGVTKAESDLTSGDVQRLLGDTKKICISEIIASKDSEKAIDKIIVTLKASSDKVLKEFRFKEATPARCMGCYIFAKSNDGSGAFSSTIATGVAKLGLNLQSVGGKIQFMMIRDLSQK